MLSLQQAGAILKRWGIRPFEILPHELVPGSPERALARTVLEDFRGARFVLEMALLPFFVIAVRFGWLSEWLRRKDVQMIEFELFYMRRLIASLDDDI